MAAIPQAAQKVLATKSAKNSLRLLQAISRLTAKAAIDKVCKERPHDYLKIVASVLPKRMELEEAASRKPLHQMTDDELGAMIWKTNQKLREMGIDLDPTDDEIAQASARRLERT